MDQLDGDPNRSEKRKEKVSCKLSLLAGGIFKHGITNPYVSRSLSAEVRLEV